MPFSPFAASGDTGHGEAGRGRRTASCAWLGLRLVWLRRSGLNGLWHDDDRRPNQVIATRCERHRRRVGRERGRIRRRRPGPRAAPAALAARRALGAALARRHDARGAGARLSAAVAPVGRRQHRRGLDRALRRGGAARRDRAAGPGIARARLGRCRRAAPRGGRRRARLGERRFSARPPRDAATLLAVERARAAAAHAHMAARRRFARLLRHDVPLVRWATPAPAEVEAIYGRLSGRPEPHLRAARPIAGGARIARRFRRRAAASRGCASPRPRCASATRFMPACMRPTASPIRRR